MSFSSFSFDIEIRCDLKMEICIKEVSPVVWVFTVCALLGL